MDFYAIMRDFHREVDAKYLALLQQNKAIIHVNIVLSRDRRSKFDIEEWYIWALFLISTKLEATYDSNPSPALVNALDIKYLRERCVIPEYGPQILRDNMEEIRSKARVFEKAMWRASCAWFEPFCRDRMHNIN